MRDVLGDFFMEHLSFGRNGQFFTPEHLCDMMAMISMPADTNHILDPACGSGRMLMASAKLHRYGKFYGADIDRTCCMMAVINFMARCSCGTPGSIPEIRRCSRWWSGWCPAPSTGFRRAPGTALTTASASRPGTPAQAARPPRAPRGAGTARRGSG